MVLLACLCERFTTRLRYGLLLACLSDRSHSRVFPRHPSLFDRFECTYGPMSCWPLPTRDVLKCLPVLLRLPRSHSFSEVFCCRNLHVDSLQQLVSST